MPPLNHRRIGYVLTSVLVALASLRLCFSGLLLSDEDYHLAAARHILHGKVPYHDFWYDKPPLAAVYYLFVGGSPGVGLRLWDAAYLLLCCFLVYRLTLSWWGETEGRIAALLLAFFTTFYLPSAVIPFAPDALLLAPHLAAIYFARERRAGWAGVFCGIGFWINVKALFVLAACALWLLSSFGWLMAGFAVVVAAGFAILGSMGAAMPYIQQVWVWGFAYAKGAPVPHPLALSLGRIANWVGFHAALSVGAAVGIFRAATRDDRWKLLVWLGLCFAAVCLGNHFAPRYFLQLLPPLVVAASRGVTLAFSRWRRMGAFALAALLIVPLIRFGPRYALVLGGAYWPDAAMDVDSQETAAKIRTLAQPGDTLFVWGYRPDVYVYSRLEPPGLFWDSQPLSGVTADRHLAAAGAIESPGTTVNLEAEMHSRPTFIVDGLGLLNSKLSPQAFRQMREQLKSYREVGRTRLSIIYRRME